MTHGWASYRFVGGSGLHVLPVDEEFDHVPANCRCQPQLDEESGVTVHNSFDGREDFENGTRKPS